MSVYNIYNIDKLLTPCIILGVMNGKYEEKLLNNWEDVFRQGLLTFWVLVALSQKEMTVSEIRLSVLNLTDNTYNTSDQALYRLLRKHYDLEIVDTREIKGNAGPNKKLYMLSETGHKLLVEFCNRNITLFMQPSVQSIIMKGKV